MPKFSIKISKEKTLDCELRDPLFRDFRFASMELNSTAGRIDKLAAGSSLIQHCWVTGDDELKNGDESKDPQIAMAYTSLCIDVYNELYKGYEVEVKKK